MPTRKIADERDHRPCSDPEHKPPTMCVFEPGSYEHECPTCKQVTVFTVRGAYLSLPKTPSDCSGLSAQMDKLANRY